VAQVFIHDFVPISNVVLGDIIDQDFLLLGVLCEVLSEALVRDELLLELIGLLELYRFVVESAGDVLYTGLDFEELLPEDGNALDHILLREGLLHLSLVQSKGLNLLTFRGLN
jgi:hypothetical protein